jgi:lysophospholipase L1-like esterase
MHFHNLTICLNQFRVPGWAWLAATLLALMAAMPCASAQPAGRWITTWAATPGPRWADELPVPFGVPEVLSNRTVRQTARISVGGENLRIVISNEFGARPITIGAATLALPAGGSAVDPATIKQVTFSGQSGAVIPPGAPLVSDPVDFPVKPLSSVVVSFYLPGPTKLSSVHWEAMQTGHVSGPGDMTKAADFKPENTTKSRLLLSRILTTAKPNSTAIVVLGDSITDGSCSTPDSNHRWTDELASRLQAEGHPDIAVVNEAFYGNRVLADGFGTSALARFNMSVLSHARVSTLVLMLGGNDIGLPGATIPNDPQPTAEDIIAGLKQMIERAHADGIRVILSTLTPAVDAFAGTRFSKYYTPEKGKIAEAVNAWIRTSSTADGVIDFRKILEDPSKPGHLAPAYDCGDHVHPNDAGYQVMAKSIDLTLLLGK